MFLVYILGGFLVFGAIATAIYMPVLRGYGVKENLFQRSAKMGAISAGSLVLSSVVIGIIFSGSASKIASLPGAIVSTLIAGHYLRQYLTIKPWIAYVTAACIAIGIVSVIFSVFVLFGAKQ